MALTAVVVSSGDPEKIIIDDVEPVDVLGGADEVALQLDEVLNIVSEAVGKSIKTESELVIEIIGTVTLRANAGAKWLVINVGGSGERQNSLKVVLTTKLNPNKNT